MTVAMPPIQSGAGVRVAVDFYDDEERTKLLNYPTAQRLLQLVDAGLVVPRAQLLTYFLFYKRRPGKPGYRDYNELGRRIHEALAELGEFVAFSGETINSAPDVDQQENSITERIGEAVALSVVNNIHGLHEADWDRIRVHPGPKGFPTFDYKTSAPDSASDGVHTIQLEAKGSAVRNTLDFGQAPRAQKKRIDDKKQKIAEHETYPYPADIRYGAVCVLGQSGPLRCLLVDPPGAAAGDAKRRQLLTRMRFLFDWVSFLKGRSQLASALATRLQDLEALEDPFVLSGVPLVRGNGLPFELGPSFGNDAPLLNGLSRVTDGPIGGVLLPAGRNELMFLGVRESVFKMAVSQEFDSLLEYSEISASFEKLIRCVVSRGRVHRLGLPPELIEPGTPTVRFLARGLLHASEGGIVFGLVKPEERMTNRHAGPW